MRGKHQNSTSVMEPCTPAGAELSSPSTSGEEYLSGGFLLRNRGRLVKSLVGLLVLASLLSYFVKPRAPFQDIVVPEQETLSAAEVSTGATSLSSRVLSSYGLAFVMIGSPYTATNLHALENLRSWAQDRFQSQPDFLHPVSIISEQEPNDTIFGALGYNFFAYIKYAAESLTGCFLRGRINDFHQSAAYQSFSDSYFEIYGKDSESAALLAKFQSERARKAIDVTLWALVWSAEFCFMLLYVGLSPRRQRFERIRHALVLFWGSVAIAYGGIAWMQNSIPALLSAFLAGCCSTYFLKPFVLLTRQDSSLKLRFIQLSSRWLALAVWAGYSLLAITILTWIRCSNPDSSDPVSLLLSGLSGDFLHDPEGGKRAIARILGILWLGVSLWSFLQKDRDAQLSEQLEAELRTL